MLAIVISSVCAGLLGAMGLGGGTLLLLYLTLIKGIDQLAAQGINLIFYIPCAGLALFFHRKNRLVKWRLGIKLSLWGIVGVFCGWWLSGWLQTAMMTKVLGAFLLVIGIKELFTRGKKDKFE